MRLFIAVSPGVDVLRRIDHLLDALRPKAPSAKWVKAESLHVTLAFLGEQTAEMAAKVSEALVAEAASHAPFELRFKGGGSFGRPSRPRILWASCDGDLAALGRLQQGITTRLVPLGHAPEDREFNPHLTLARARDHAGDPALARCVPGLQNEDFGAVTVTEVTLYESRLSPAGPHYEPLVRARLTGSGPLAQ
ncbi:MAG: RNA 2',3'-cyclic phosphodiesterase [Polyangiaceae bacterium]